MAREILEKTKSGSSESIVYLGAKSLYTNVPLKEAVEKALRRVYERINPPEISRKTKNNYAQVYSVYKKTV